MKIRPNNKNIMTNMLQNIIISLFIVSCTMIFSVASQGMNGPAGGPPGGGGGGGAPGMPGAQTSYALRMAQQGMKHVPLNQGFQDDASAKPLENLRLIFFHRHV